MSSETFTYNDVTYTSTKAENFFEDESGELKSSCQGCALFEKALTYCLASEEVYNCAEFNIIWKVKEEKEKINAQDK